MKTRILFTAVSIALLFSACSDSTEKAVQKAPEAPPEAVTGSSAFFKMYAAARGGWSVDLQPLRLVSIHLPQVKAEPGKAGAWQATFVSPSKMRARSYTYSVVEAEGNLHKGVFAGNDETWNGPRAPVQPFLVAGLKKDSDAAYATALKKGKRAEDYVKAHPDMTVTFLLEQNKKFPQASWRVIWGESVGTSNYSVFVDASTGEYLETMH
jgi:hypothetical protein